MDHKWFDLSQPPSWKFFVLFFLSTVVAALICLLLVRVGLSQELSLSAALILMIAFDIDVMISDYKQQL